MIRHRMVVCGMMGFILASCHSQAHWDGRNWAEYCCQLQSHETTNAPEPEDFHITPFMRVKGYIECCHPDFEAFIQGYQNHINHACPNSSYLRDQITRMHKNHKESCALKPC